MKNSAEGVDVEMNVRNQDFGCIMTHHSLLQYSMDWHCIDDSTITN